MREVDLRKRFDLSLSAASGLVARAGIAYVIGDDRAALDRHRLDDGAALEPIPLLDLPATAVLCKQDKPDLEMLVDLGASGLLALGSGSRKNRARAFRVSLDGEVQGVDLSALYERLASDIADLNIEGAVLCGDCLVLAHRGVGDAQASRLIYLDAASALDKECRAWPATLLRAIHPVALGTLDGVALAFTDLACDDNGVVHYLAAAEATDDAYLDGNCRGSVLGCIESDGTATTLTRLRPDLKAEGLALRAHHASGTQWWVVTDADDPAQRAALYDVDMPG